MRWCLVLPVISLLALPIAACAQDQQPQPAPDSAGAPTGQYQPGTLPPEPPVIEPPLPGQADNMAPPPGPNDGQPPLPGQADNMAPPPAPDDGQPPPPPPGAYPAPRHDHDAEMMQKFQVRFDTANTTHDGRLTLEQAEAADMRAVVKHFAQIDTRHLGYVTLNEVVAWKMDQMAQQMERRAAQLRAQQGQ